MKTASCKKPRQLIVDMVNEISLLIMFYHLFTFGDSGTVNGTDSQIVSQKRI